MPAKSNCLRSETALTVCILSVLVAAPLAIAPGFAFHYDVTPKIAVILAGAALAAALAPAWFTRLRASLGEQPARLLMFGLGLQALSVAVSAAFSRDPALSVVGAEWRRLGLATELALVVLTLAVAGWAISSPSRILQALRAVLIPTLAASVYGVSQYFGVDPWQSAGLYHSGEGVWSIVRPPATLGHAGYFATFLLHGVSAGCGVAVLDSKRWRTLGRVTTFAAAVAIVLSGSRSAILGLLVGAVWLFLRLKPVLNRRVLVSTSALVAVAALFYVSPAGERLRARTRWSIEDASGGGRAWLWRDAFRLGLDEWATGAGPDTFSASFLPFQSLRLTQVVPERYYESPHNIFLDAWSTQGLGGLLSLVLMLTAGGWAVFRSRGADSRPSACLGAGLLAALVSNQFLAFVAVTKLYFLIWIALLVARSASVSPAPRPKPVARGAQALCIVAGAAFAWFGWLLVRSDRLLEQVRTELAAGRPEAAATIYDRFLALKPAGMYADLWYSRRLLDVALSSPNPAIASSLLATGAAAAERAIVNGETPQNGWYSLATFRAELGDVDGAVVALQAAADAAPQWYKPHWMLAQMLEASGRLDEARRRIQRASELTGGREPSVQTVQKRLESR